MTTESMKPYPAYKDSGIEWIGEIPEGWDVRKLKHLADVKLSNIDKKSKEDEPTVKLCNYVDVYYKDNITPNIKFMVATARKDQIDALSLEKGDVLITKDSESPDDIAVPAFVPESLSGIVCGYHLARIRPNEDAYGNYLFRSFLSNGIRDQFEMNANGITRFGIGKYTIDNSLFLVPPLTEQQSIATFLDNQTTKIDTLIEKKQKQIELLKEERTAIINQAVTKGLNPDVSMRDSGIEWLGEIPEHWELIPLKYLLLDGKNGIKIGPFGSSLKSDIITSKGYKVYGQENIINDDFSIGHRFVDENTFDKLNVYEIYENDILITMMGTTGKSKVVPADIKKGIMDSHLIRIRNNNNSNSHFISLLINDSNYIYSQLKKNSKGSIMEGLNSSIVKSLLIACPPLNEQKHILYYIQKQKNKLDYEIHVSENQITFLKEYRTALISEAVTGKIDLRNQHELSAPK